MLGSPSVLAALGISETEETVYRALVRSGRGTLAQIGDAAGVPRVALRKALEALEAKGLVSHAPGKTPAYIANAPEAAMEVLILQRMEELGQARIAASELTREFRSAAELHAPGELVEILVGGDAVIRRVEQIQRGAQTEICIFDKPPYQTPGVNETELEMLARGVRYRVIYDPTALEVTEQFDAIDQMAAAGEEIRVLPVPMKMAVIDRAIGFVPVATRGKEIDGAVIVHSSFLLEALASLFDAYWERAVPFGTPEGAQPDLSADERALLALLVAGSKDEAIARQLRISLRTLRRRASDLLDRLGARTRFQAGALAARRGWV